MEEKLEDYFDRLWPITRSLSGDGNRETLKILQEIIPLKITEVPSGTACFDWIVPPEWNVKEAWIKDSKGNVIVDFKNNNLHIVGYSTPFQGVLTYDELVKHLHTIPGKPDLIPYVTSYYSSRWGFCMTHNAFVKLNRDEKFQVLIDSSLDDDGSMTVGDLLVEGKTKKEVFLSTYICHPSMANNELSGPLVAAFLYQELKNRPLKYSYRFCFAPETIGAIYYLSNVGRHLVENMVAGFVITTVGDPGEFTYKKSRRGNALTDRAVELVLKQSETKYTIEDFFPSGSDERQYCSPGFNLPVGALMRTRYERYHYYHTSGDNKDFISFTSMKNTVLKYLEVIDVLEANDIFINQKPFCEPRLGNLGLYPTISSPSVNHNSIDAYKWILNLSDGTCDLIDICNRSGHHYKTIIEGVQILLKKKLLKVAGGDR